MSISKKNLLLYITTGLGSGGGQTILYNLLSRLDKDKFQLAVISLMDNGIFGELINDLGIPVYTIGMKQGIPTPTALWRLINITNKLKPDLIQGWMYHGNLAAYLASIFLLRKIPVFWSIHHSINSLSSEKLLTRLIIKIGVYISPFIDKILFVSGKSKLQHKAIGYSVSNCFVIPNGFDTSLFQPSLEEKLKFKQKLELAEDTFLIGLFARYHPMKDHANFINAARILCANHKNVHFVLAGNGTDSSNQELNNLIQQSGVSSQFHLLGEQSDMHYLTATLDIMTLSSAYGEAFPLVVGEAMSCGIPCVVTDVGDSAWIVGDTGIVVPPKDSKALANAWQKLIALNQEEREALGRLARVRIDKFFSLDSIVSDYEKFYCSTI